MVAMTNNTRTVFFSPVLYFPDVLPVLITLFRPQAPCPVALLTRDFSSGGASYPGLPTVVQETAWAQPITLKASDIHVGPADRTKPIRQEFLRLP